MSYLLNPYIYGGFVPGLAGKFFNGTWRSTISTGNIGTLPLTTTNNSSNVTGTGGLPSNAHRYGVNLWPYITYTTLGNSYGFIAIGYFTPPTTGTYNFWTSSDDGSGVWIGEIASAASGRTTSNAVVNNNMGGGQGNTKRGGSISLTGGVSYAIRIVHEEGGGGDNLTFSWSGPGISETTSLNTYFKTPGSISNDITGITCATANEGGTASASVPTGNIIKAIDFLSYGTPTGSCGSFAIGSCHTTKDYSSLIGQSSFSIPATNANFGDPCGGTAKRLYVQVSHGPANILKGNF